MAQVVNNSDAFNTPSSGVGAVIFDNPRTKVLDILLDQNNDLDNYLKIKQAKQAQQAATTNALMKDLKLTEDGVMLQHVPYFKQKAQGVYEAAAKIYGKYNGDLSSPQAQQEWVQQVQLPSQQFELEVKGSKDLGQTLEKVRGELNTKPDDWNQDASHANIAMARLMSPDKLFSAPDQLNVDALLVPNQTAFFDMIKEDAKEFAKNETVKKDEKGNIVTVGLPFGGKAFVKEKGIQPQSVPDLAFAYMQSPQKVTQATREYNGLLDNDPLLKQSIDDEAQKRGLSPVQVYMESVIAKIPRGETIQQVTEGTAYKEGIKFGYKQKEEADNAKYIAEQLGNVMAGKAPVYGDENVESEVAQDEALGLAIPTLKPQSTWYSGALRGTKAGVYSQPVMRSDGQGGVIETGVVEPKDNVILGWKYVNGVPYVRTSESTIYKKVNNKKVDNEGYYPADEQIITAIASSNKIPYSVLRETLAKGGGYQEKAPKPQELADKNAPTVQAATIKTETPTPQPKKQEPAKNKGAETITIKEVGASFNVAKKAKGYQLSKDKKKAKVTYVDGTTEIINL